jgi:hypothetical protein
MAVACTRRMVLATGPTHLSAGALMRGWSCICFSTAAASTCPLAESRLLALLRLSELRGCFKAQRTPRSGQLGCDLG